MMTPLPITRSVSHLNCGRDFPVALKIVHDIDLLLRAGGVAELERRVEWCVLAIDPNA